MTVLLNSFEGGTSGVTVSAANSGGASGNAFDVVTIGTGGTFAFSSAHAAHGSLSASVGTGGTAAATYVTWSTSIGTPAQVWFRMYLYFPSLPSAATRLFTVLNTGSSGVVKFGINTNGTIFTQNVSGATITTSAASIPTAAWFRLEGMALLSATVGQTEVKLFTSADGTVPAETDTSTPSQDTLSGSPGSYLFGPAAGVANQGPFWMDDVGLSNTGYIGPVVVPIPVSTTPVLLAAATVKATPGVTASFRLVNGLAPIYLGGPKVTAANGVQVAAGATFPGHLFAGDQVWAVTASGTSVVSVFQTGR